MTGMDLIPTGGDFPSQGLAHHSALSRRHDSGEMEANR